MSYQPVIDFWFDEIDPKQWWRQDDEFDRRIRERFGALHAQASKCELFAWRTSALGRLAEIIVLDQFSRNMFRNTAQAFAFDPLALALAQEAITARAPEALEPAKRAFLYMPFMHSESLLIHEMAARLFAEQGMDSNLDFEPRHKVIIERFGRYPHRNALLGRASSDEEIEFLKTPGSSF
jgi:uncharacterized protein (DUF924 family)